MTTEYLLASAPQTTRGVAVKLSSDSKGEQIVYTNGKTVFLRDIKRPEICQAYTEHTCSATVARISPSGYYVASGDVNGNVRVWDATQETHILKYQGKVLTNRINDLAWDSESKRLIAVGDGKEKFGYAFFMDSGGSVGEISGHNKVINACSIRQQRPFRAVTASDDMTVNFYEVATIGVPFKFKCSINDHSRFVQDVAFSPNGDHFVSVGSDGKIFLYQGATADKLKQLGSHDGGIFAVAWSPDSKRILTSSGDKTARLWDVETSAVVQTWSFGGDVDDQQVGNLWQGPSMISLSLGGTLNVLDDRGSIARVIRGHSKGITAVEAVGPTFFTGSYDGRVVKWTDMTAVEVQSNHTNQISGLAFDGSDLISVGMDDILFKKSTKVSFTSIPRGVGVSNSLSFVALADSVVAVQDSILATLKVEYEPSCISVNKNLVAVGDANNPKTFLYSWDGKLTLIGTLDSNRGPITSVAFTPDGSLIAVADAQRSVFVYEVSTKQLKLNQWVFHSAKVNSVAWAPSGKRCASGGLDTSVIVWSVDQPMKKIVIKNAHQESVTGVVFVSEDRLVSTGQDGCVRVWDIQ